MSSRHQNGRPKRSTCPPVVDFHRMEPLLLSTDSARLSCLSSSALVCRKSADKLLYSSHLLESRLRIRRSRDNAFLQTAVEKQRNLLTWMFFPCKGLAGSMLHANSQQRLHAELKLWHGSCHSKGLPDLQTFRCPKPACVTSTCDFHVQHPAMA